MGRLYVLYCRKARAADPAGGCGNDNGSCSGGLQTRPTGLIEIHAMSEPARVSDTLQLNVTKEGATVIIITPTTEVTPQPPLWSH